jgi:hypothetical protein
MNLRLEVDACHKRWDLVKRSCVQTPKSKGSGNNGIHFGGTRAFLVSTVHSLVTA